MTHGLLVLGSDWKEQFAMRRAKTHFEQIPVEVVKKIAEAGSPEKKEIRNEGLIRRVPAQGTEPHPARARWLCRKGV